jgi:hypothetical protein
LESSTRASASRKPPAKMAASSRRSSLGTRCTSGTATSGAGAISRGRRCGEPHRHQRQRWHAEDTAPLADRAAVGRSGSGGRLTGRRGGSGPEDGLHLPQALAEPVQFGGAPGAVLLGSGEQAAAVDRRGEAGGQRGLVRCRRAPSRRAASPSCWEVAPRSCPSTMAASSAVCSRALATAQARPPARAAAASWPRPAARPAGSGGDRRSSPARTTPRSTSGGMKGQRHPEGAGRLALQPLRRAAARSGPAGKHPATSARADSPYRRRPVATLRAFGWQPRRHCCSHDAWQRGSKAAEGAGVNARSWRAFGPRRLRQRSTAWLSTAQRGASKAGAGCAAGSH